MGIFETKGRLVVLLLLLLVIGCSSRTGKEIMAEENPNEENVPSEEQSETPNIPALEKFIFTHDEYTNSVVPRKLDASEVGRFLTDRLKNTDNVYAFKQTEKVANFYDTHEVAEKYKTFLDKQESEPEDIIRSTIIARIIARVGKADDTGFAKTYYDYLIQKADTIVQFENLIMLHEALALGSDSANIRGKIKDKTEALEAQKDSDYQAKIAYLNFQEKIGDSLEQAEKVQLIKDDIKNTADYNERVSKEIKAYLGIEYGYLEFLRPWAAGRIRRETWAPLPANQITRNDKAPLKKKVAVVFKDFLGKLGEFPTLGDKDKEAAKLRILRAIKFFDGTVTDDEEGFLELNRGNQSDLLSNQGYLLDKIEVR